MQDRVWVCKDGRRYTVSQMRLGHIQNSLRLMDKAAARGKSWREEFRDRLELELTIRSLK